MHRFLYLARRHPQLDAAAFMQRWQAHEALAAGCADVLAEVRGYRQWQVMDGPEADVMGVAETRCADAAAVHRMLGCADTRLVLQPDERRFLAVPCRQSGLVADDRTLEGAGVSGDHACLWLAPRLAAAASPAVQPEESQAVEARIKGLHARLREQIGTTPVHLSAGRRDAGDTESPFAALLFARCASPALAMQLTAGWRSLAQPGETVWCLQRAGRPC